MLDLDPNRPIVEPVGAATVIVARHAAASGGVEVFCVERHLRSGFLGGAIVFPGGKIDAADRAPEWAALTSGVPTRARALGDDAEARAFLVAAARECAEEAAILPIVGDHPDHDALIALQAALAAAERDAGERFRQRITREGWHLDTSRFTPLWRWVTPTAERRRFDTPFFLLELPPNQRGQSDQRETTKGFWEQPARLLERWERGELFLAPPTSHSLDVMARAGSIEALRERAEHHSMAPICPELAAVEGQTVLALPGDPLHSQTTPVPGTEDGPTRFVLGSDGRFVGQIVR
ncbi:MAG: hypothetical protein KIT72_15145 [Polyangiaceae bacterium]|nr:hypothetical protein [Polyangiaceae bacterium]MCW5791751.1 hypothetical protein [Polyangiaceae bacterium]